MFYTYVWRDELGAPFYVGKGSGGRSGELRGRSPEFLAIHARGYCTVEIVDEFIHESQAHAHEMDLIEKYGRREFGGVLVNKTDGGEGVSGCIPGAETRAKMSAAQTGKVLSIETRAKLSEAKIGTRLSESTKAKMSVSRTGKKQTAEHIRNSAEARRGAKRSPSLGFALKKFHITSSPKPGSLKGICFNRTIQKWQARIMASDKRKFLGYFDNPQDAARAYDAAAYAEWGDSCYLNFRDQLAAA